MFKKFVLIFLFIFTINIIFAGWHTASSILPGTFPIGNFVFDGSVGIGVTPETQLHVYSGDSGVSPGAVGDDVFIESAGDTGINIGAGNTSQSSIFFGDSSDWAAGRIRYDHMEDDLSFGTNGGADNMVIDSGGNVGIGVDNPSALLHLMNSVPVIVLEDSNAANTTEMGTYLGFWNSSGDECGWVGYGSSTNNHLTVKNKDGDIYFVPNGYSIFQTGNVGIGTTTPSSELSVNGRITTIGGYQSTPAYTFISDNDTGIYSSNADSLRFSAGGVLRVSMSNSISLDVAGDIVYTGTITDVSDRRLKENLIKINNSLSKIQNLTGYTFNMVNETSREAGVIAQNVQKVLPEAVSIIDNENHLGVDYTQLVPLLIEGIKDQQDQIEELKLIVCKDYPEEEICD